MHFNENVHREKRQTKAGTVYYNVIYPKYKFGEEVVREIAAPPTYGKLMKLMLVDENAVLYTCLIPDKFTSHGESICMWRNNKFKQLFLNVLHVNGCKVHVNFFCISTF